MKGYEVTVRVPGIEALCMQGEDQRIVFFVAQQPRKHFAPVAPQRYVFSWCRKEARSLFDKNRALAVDPIKRPLSRSTPRILVGKIDMGAPVLVLTGVDDQVWCLADIDVFGFGIIEEITEVDVDDSVIGRQNQSKQ